jgi:nucleotide-binding universal stress UspA family protein
MLKIDKILCPVDFSEFSKMAFEYALSIALRYKAKLYVLHVIEPVTAVFSYETLPGWRELYAEFRVSAQQALEELITAEGAEDVHPETVLEVGNPADLILKYARTQNVDLIVMGSHAKRGLDRILKGLVTERVLQNTRCPVLAVRKPAHHNAGQERPRAPAITKILVPTDFSGHAQCALEYALSLATEYHAQLTLLHVFEQIPRDKDLDSEKARVTHEMRASLPLDARDQPGVSTAVRIGKPYCEIVDLAAESETDLIVMGTHGHRTLDIAVFGPTTYRVLQLGPCPVLSVPIDTPQPHAS